MQHVAILPTGKSTLRDSADLADVLGVDTRFLRLPHPRTRAPTLFLPGASRLLEVQAIAPGDEQQRAWFVAQHVLSDGKLTLMTPMDPMFLLVALLTALARSAGATFLSIPDLFDAFALLPFLAPTETGKRKQEEEELEVELGYPIGEDAARLGVLDYVQRRLLSVCDCQEYEGQKLYRLSADLTLALLREKISALTDPATGIFGPYCSTALGVARPALPDEEVIEEKDEVLEQLFPTVARGLSREGAGDGTGLSEELQLETRQKSAIGILSNYLPPSVAAALVASYPFPLLKALTSVAPSSVLSTTYLPGRASSTMLPAAGEKSALGGGNGFGAAAAAAKKKKAALKGSRGVETLKKASTRGMKTLAEMFQKPKK